MKYHHRRGMLVGRSEKATLIVFTTISLLLMVLCYFVFMNLPQILWTGSTPILKLIGGKE